MSFSLLQLLRDIPLAFVDVETTGASADFGHRIIEIGIVRLERGRIVGEYQQLVDPERRISPGVTALTGITQAMVKGQPTFAQQLPAVLRLLSDDELELLGESLQELAEGLRKPMRDEAPAHVVD